MRTELESGAWVEHRPIHELVGGDRRKLARLRKPEIVVGDDGTPDLGATARAMDMYAWLDTQHDGIWALLITAWSWDLPVPDLIADEVLHTDSIEQIPLDDYDEIEALFAPFAAKLARRADPKGGQSGTTSASNGRSRAKGHSPTG